MQPRVLVVTPRFPFPEAGADEQDRAAGIRQLVRLGCSVRVVAKYFPWQDGEAIRRRWAAEGVEVVLVPYLFHNTQSFAKAFFWLQTFDGSATEYAEHTMQKAVATAAADFKPTVFWFDYTYLWPLYHVAEAYGAKIIVRSINFEADHYREEVRGDRFANLKYFLKVRTEKITANAAHTLFAISPRENERYSALGGRAAVVTLPLRSLPPLLGTHRPRHTDTLNVFFTGSTYTVAHNRRALEFVLRDVAPQLLGRNIQIHIFGSKLPAGMAEHNPANVTIHGFVDDMSAALQTMDIAIAPSFFGAGMQQKIFEPLARGFPTITSARGLAGYPFVPNEEVLIAENVAEYVAHLTALADLPMRERLSNNCVQRARLLFSQAAEDAAVAKALREE